MVCKRKKFINVWPRSNHYSRMLRAQRRIKHWPNLRHDDAACGAWGTWRIPMGGFASQKSMVTCAKCRRLCGLDGGPDLRKVVTDYKAVERRREKQNQARLRRWAKAEAEKVVAGWARSNEQLHESWGWQRAQEELADSIAWMLLKAKGCRS